MQRSLLYTILTVPLLLSACTEPSGAPGRGIEQGGALSKQNIGTVGGAVAGGFLGSAIGGGTGRTIAIIGGGLLGGLMGREVGASLDRADQLAYERKTERALNTGRTQYWSSDSGTGTIIPHQRFTDDVGRNCREFTQKVTIEGQTQRARGTACREDDGSWRIVS